MDIWQWFCVCKFSFSLFLIYLSNCFHLHSYKHTLHLNVMWEMSLYACLSLRRSSKINSNPQITKCLAALVLSLLEIKSLLSVFFLAGYDYRYFINCLVNQKLWHIKAWAWLLLNFSSFDLLTVWVCLDWAWLICFSLLLLQALYQNNLKIAFSSSPAVRDTAVQK